MLQPVPAALESTRATVDLDLEHRRKGLLWYATYTVAFKGTYTFRNPDAEARELHVRLPLPAENAALRRLRLHGRRSCRRSSRRRVKGDDGRRECRAGRGRHPRRAVPIARARHVDLRLRRKRRRAGARLQPGAADEFPGHRLPRRHRLAERDDRDAGRLGADVDVREPDLRPGDRHGAAREAEPRSLRGARHVLRARVAPVLPRRDGDGGHDVRTAAPSDALLVHRRRVLRVPPAAGLSGRSRQRCTSRSRRPPSSACSSSSATCVWSPACGARCWSPAPLSSSSGALQLRVLLRGLHRAGDHGGRHPDALRPDADDGARVVGRDVPRRNDAPIREDGHASRASASPFRQVAPRPQQRSRALDRATRRRRDRDPRACSSSSTSQPRCRARSSEVGLVGRARRRADPAHHDRPADQRARAAAARGPRGAVRAPRAGGGRLRARRLQPPHREPDAGRTAERPRSLSRGAAEDVGVACRSPAAG